jgi:Mg-chelatase subunit ChlD
MAEPAIRQRWEKAVAEASDQRALNIAKNVQSRELREKLEEAADNAARKAVTEAAGEAHIHVMFLVDKSGSMEGAIDKSKEALSRILAGFPPERLHIASFDTMGTVLRPKAASRAAVQHMLTGIKAGGGTVHGAGVRALSQAGVTVPAGAKLIVIVVGDEAGEAGDQFARSLRACGYDVAAMALLLSLSGNAARGNTVRGAATQLQVPYSEVAVEHFDDPYQVPRVLKTLLDAPRMAGGRQSGWVERVMNTPLLQPS